MFPHSILNTAIWQGVLPPTPSPNNAVPTITCIDHLSFAVRVIIFPLAIVNGTTYIGICPFAMLDIIFPLWTTGRYGKPYKLAKSGPKTIDSSKRRREKKSNTRWEASSFLVLSPFSFYFCKSFLVRFWPTYASVEIGEIWQLFWTLRDVDIYGIWTS